MKHRWQDKHLQGQYQERANEADVDKCNNH